MKKKENKKIRLKDIAELAGVSMGTVDRVLHNRGEVSEQTRQKVLKTTEKLDYKPNLFARSLALKKTFSFGAILPHHYGDNHYWEAPYKGILKAENEIKDFNARITKYHFHQFDDTSFHEQAEKILKDKPDAVLFAPILYNASLEFVKELDKEGIPYVFIDSNLEGQNNLTYIGQNTFQSGYLAAKLLCYGTNDPGHMLSVKIANKNGHSNSLYKRLKGFIAYFEDHYQKHEYTIHQMDISDNDPKLIQQHLDSFFDKVKNIKGIFIPNSKAYRIAEYIKNRQKADIKLIGYDLLQKNIQFLNEQLIDFLIAQNPEEQGYEGIMTLFNKLVLNREIKKINYRPIDIITKENVQYYLKED